MNFKKLCDLFFPEKALLTLSFNNALFLSGKCKKNLFHPSLQEFHAKATYLGVPCVLSHGTSLKLLQETQRFGRRSAENENSLDGREWNNLYVVHDGQGVIIICLML